MKNYIIGLLIVVILVLSSLVYKFHTTANKTLSVIYPVEINKLNRNPKLNLFVFFSKKNCQDCLGIVDVLNNLPPSQFVIRGIIPENELKDTREIRSKTGATFPIEGEQRFDKLIPKYTPSIVGVSDKSDLFFIIPGVPGEKDYLERFLNSFYQKVYTYLLSIK